METRAPGTSRRLPPHRTCGPAAPPGPKMPQGNAHGEDSARFCPGSHGVGCQRFSKLGEIPTLPLCCLRERAERGGGGGRAAARSQRKLEDGNGSCWLFRATSSCKSLVWRCPRSLLSTHQEPKHLTPNPALSSTPNSRRWHSQVDKSMEFQWIKYRQGWSCGAGHDTGTRKGQCLTCARTSDSKLGLK